MNDLAHDAFFLFAVITGGYLTSVFLYKALEVLYWKYADWRWGQKDEDR